MNRTDHPYRRLPDKAFWRRSVAGIAAADVDPVGVFDLRLERDTRVATAGSCFAQHIARHLQQSGYNYYVTEPGHPILPKPVRDKHHYGIFSARYGNIYTARQLLQLMLRAYGEFHPQEDCWIEPDGSVLDPFRPAVQPRGFVSESEMRCDRAQHLAAVRTLFETLDVFVFTLGLTECWVSRADGAAFPLCPGVEGGQFDHARHAFLNQDVDQVFGDVSDFFCRLRQINPGAQMVLTVSPVPLMATAEPGAHVLAATTLSKSVLRVAAEMLRKKFDGIHYFPSYEIITGAFNRGGYYARDLRGITEDGVAHVMRLFLQHASGGALPAVSSDKTASAADSYLASAESVVEVECDEVALDRE